MKALLIVAALIASACSNPSPAAPTPTQPAPVPIAACVSQNTAELTLLNASPTQATYDILIDNVRRGTIGIGQSATYTVTAGQPHVIVSQFTNSTIVACNSTSSLIQCSTQTFTCRG